jgi:hypothetical protein
MFFTLLFTTTFAHVYLKRVCIHRLTIRNRHSDGTALEAGPANAQGGGVGEGSGEDSHSTMLLAVAEGPEVNDSDVSKGGRGRGGGGGGVLGWVPAHGLF